jgi:basic membrane protein A and related proteins
MRTSTRRLRARILAACIPLLLLAAACGNDQPADAPQDTPAATETEAAPESPADSPEETATEAAGDAEGSQVTLSELCETEYAGVQAPEGFRVGLVTDIGSVDDGTFNQFAYEGMEAAAECFGFETNFIETASEADYTNNLNTILADEPDVVVTVGFLLADATKEFAGSHPDVRFVGVDQFQEDYGDNYVGILFREDQGGFLAGAMAGLLTESGVVGVVGGREDVPPVVRFVNGYESGAEHVNPEVNVLKVYNQSFADPAKGASDAQQMMGEGADVIFGAGGPTGSGGVRAAAEAGAWGIGVDQDEYFTTFGGGGAPGADRLATSAIKRVDLGVFTTIAQAVQEEFTGGVFELTAENNGITYAPFHDADVPDDVAAQLEEIRQGLADGSIDTGVDPITGQPL